MAKRFLVDLDLNTNQLQNAVIQTASADPSGVKGRIYFNNVSNYLRVYDGTTWQNLATGTNAANAVSLTGDLSGNASAVNGVITVSATIAANSVALGTDTTGNYVASVGAGNYMSITGTAGEGWTPVFAVDATTASTASKVVARDASGDVYARTFLGNLTGVASSATLSSSVVAGAITNTEVAANAGIVPSKLSASTVTVGSTAIGLGGTSTTLAGLTSITSTSVTGTLYGNAASATVSASSNTSASIDWAGVGNKPDPVVTVVLSGDVTGNANATLTDLTNASVSITTTIAANSVALGTDTTGNYVAGATASTGVTITGTPGEGWTPVFSIGQPVATTDNVSFASLTTSGDVAVNGGDITTTSTGTATVFNANATTLNIGGAATTVSIGAATGTTTINNSLVVGGDLTVSGSVTTLNTATLFVEDNVVILNSGVTGTPSLDAGIEVERGTSLNVSVLWNETSDLWTLTNDGTNYHQVARKSSHTITANSSSTSFVLTHNLATRDVAVNVYAVDAPYDTVEVDIERTDTNNVTVRFATAPTTGTNYRAVIVG